MPSRKAYDICYLKWLMVYCQPKQWKEPMICYPKGTIVYTCHPKEAMIYDNLKSSLHIKGYGICHPK